MSDDVGERFLRDAEDRDGDVDWHTIVIAIEYEVDAEPGVLIDTIREPFERGREAEVLEHARTELLGEAADAVDRVDDQRAELAELLSQRRFGRHLLDELQTHQQQRQCLARVVVQLTRHPRALRLLRGEDARRESACPDAVGLELSDLTGHVSDRIPRKALPNPPLVPGVVVRSAPTDVRGHVSVVEQAARQTGPRRRGMLPPMRILFASDGSRGAAVAEDFLLALPLGAEDDVSILTIPTVSEREACALLSRIHWRFAARHLTVSTVMRRGAPAEVVEAVALERAIELIVVGSRGLGPWTGTLLGSVSRGVARSVPASVLVVRATHEAPRRVVVAVDASADARAAVTLMKTLPLPMSASIELLRLDAPSERGAGDYVVERARLVLGARLSRVSDAAWDHVGEAVLRHAVGADADLIVLGIHDQTIAPGLMRTSVVDHVLSHAHCAVLVAKPPVCARTLAVGAAAGVAFA